MADKEYIERDAATFPTYYKGPVLEGSYRQGWNHCLRAIYQQPAADVVEVRKAKWITGNENPRTYGRIRAMCGRCGAFALYEFVNVGSFKECLSNYCPNCGAKITEV